MSQFWGPAVEQGMSRAVFTVRIRGRNLLSFVGSGSSAHALQHGLGTLVTTSVFT